MCRLMFQQLWREGGGGEGESRKDNARTFRECGEPLVYPGFRVQVVSLLTVSLAWVVLWLPSHLFAFSDLLGLEWRIPHGAIVASVIVGYAHAAVMPLLWLLHQPIRVAMAALVFCRCCRGNGEDPDDSIEFQDVGPYRPAEVTG